jgi:hypothetical protein
MRAFLVLLAAALLLVPGIARAPLPGAMDAPAWSPGDNWNYRFNSTFAGSIFLNGTLRAEVQRLANVTVRGVGVDVFVVDTDGTGTLEGVFPTPLGDLPAAGFWNLTGEQLFATGSRTIVRTLITISAAGQVGILDLPFSLLWINSTSSRVVRDEWTYPVPVGFSGYVTLNASMAEDVFLQFGTNPPLNSSTLVDAEVTFAVSLLSRSEATVPAGTFETYVVQESWPDGGTERFEYAPASGNNARTRTYNSTGAEITRTELVSYRYQAGEAPPSRLPILAAVLAIAVAVPLVAWWVFRRRRREREYTPPSLREPPTSGP